MNLIKQIVKQILVVTIFSVIFSGITPVFAEEKTELHGIVNESEVTVVTEYGDNHETVTDKIRTTLPDGSLLLENEESVCGIQMEFENETFPMVSFDKFNITIDEKDTQPPIIEWNNRNVPVGTSITQDMFSIRAYDVIDGELEYTVDLSNINSNAEGTYYFTISATDKNGLSTTETGTIYIYRPIDRNNLYFRGKKVNVSGNVSDDTIRTYERAANTVPWDFYQYISNITIVEGYTDLGSNVKAYVYYTNGKMYFATNFVNESTVDFLHECAHLYDYHKNGGYLISDSAEFAGIFEREKYNLPCRYGGNMRDDTMEWFANIVVFYYYDRAYLQANAPESYNFLKGIGL